MMRASVISKSIDGRSCGAAKTYTVIDFTETPDPEIMEQIGSRHFSLFSFKNIFLYVHMFEQLYNKLGEKTL